MKMTEDGRYPNTEQIKASREIIKIAEILTNSPEVNGSNPSLVRISPKSLKKVAKTLISEVTLKKTKSKILTIRLLRIETIFRPGGRDFTNL